MEGKENVSKINSIYQTGFTVKHKWAEVRYCRWPDALSECCSVVAEAGWVAWE